MPPAWIPANNGGVAYIGQRFMLLAGGEPGCSAKTQVFFLSMSTRTPALRSTVLAANASLALLSFSVSAQTQIALGDDAGLDTLPTTVVTASGFKENAATQTQGVSIITAQDIAQSGARSVSEALQRVLGLLPMKLDLSGTGSAGIDLRGWGGAAWSNQVVIVDGLRMNEGDLSAPQLANLPIDSIERIEVVRGAASVLYGEGASAGAIIISTKAGLGIARKTGGSVTAGVGSKDLRELAAQATFATQNGFSLDASLQKRKADNHRQNFDADSQVARIGAQWSNDWLRLGVHIGQDDKKNGLPGGLTAAQYAANPWQAATPNDRVKQRSNQQGIFVQAQLADWELALDSNWRDKASRSVSAFGSYDFDLDARNSSLRARQQIKTANLSNALTIGYDESHWERKVLGAFPSTAKAKNSGWYIKDELNLPTSGTQLSAGLRSQKTQKEESGSASSLSKRVNAWELGIAQTLTSEWTAFARAAKALRMANVDEFSFVAPGYNIQPQTSKDLEAGLRWNSAANKLELRAYRSRAKNEIGYDPLFPNPLSWTGLGANVNFDPTTRSGLELDVHQQISSNLRLQANAAVRKAKFSSGTYTGNTVPLVAKQTLSLGATWQVNAQHSLNARANWVGKQQVDFNNTCRVPSYNTLDVGYRFERGAWQLNAQIQNLGNKKYYSTAYGCAAGQATSIYPEAGRQLGLNLRYQF